MLNQLDEYLKSDMLDDYWYDDALFICEDIIRKFSDEEWRKLKDMLPKEDMCWNIRLVECLGDINNQYAAECIVKLLNTDNVDLFIACVDSLRDKDMSLFNINDLQGIACKVKALIGQSSLPVRKVLQSFIEKTEN